MTPGVGSRMDAADRFAEVEARLDALKRRCTTGYACGSACISPQKECRSAGGRTAIGKERLNRLQQLAQGDKAGRGIGQLRGAAAAAKVEEIQAARTQQAAQLRQQRQQRRPAGALATTTAMSPQGPPSPAPGSAARPQRMAEVLSQTLNDLRAADARQMGLIAEQLFEVGWSLERRTRYRGMSKEQARDQFKAEMLQSMRQSTPEATSAAQGIRQRASQAGSVSGAMKSLLSDMQAGDRRLQELGRQAIDLRVQAFELGEKGDEPGLGGGRPRRRLRGR